MLLPVEEEQGEEEVHIEKDQNQSTNDEEGKYPSPSIKKASWKQYQMSKVTKDVDPAITKIGMLGNYKEV